KKIRNETFSYNEKIKIIFGNAQIKIKPKHPSESIRILGVWFNAKNNQNFVVGQAKEEIWNLSNLMKNKRITDKHLLYILNKLIKKILVQKNDKKQLRKITKLRLRNLQKKEWLAKGLLEYFPFDKKPRKYKNNFIFNNLLLCKENDITFEISEGTKTNVDGGRITLHKILEKDYNKFKYQLRKDSIIFLEQILTIDKTELLTWKEIEKKKIKNKIIRKLKQQNYIKKNITINHYRINLEHTNNEELYIEKCKGCVLNTENQNHYMEYCRINIEFEDLIIFNNNGTKKKNGR